LHVCLMIHDEQLWVGARELQKIIALRSSFAHNTSRAEPEESLGKLGTRHGHSSSSWGHTLVASGEKTRRTHKMPRLIDQLKRTHGWPIRRGILCVRQTFSPEATSNSRKKSSNGNV
jgi:hypothetical protein